MPNQICRNCGAEIPEARATCPVCGSSGQRTGSPAEWEPWTARRSAILAGLVLALLILGALVWRIADSRRTPLDSHAPILPMGSDR